MVYTSGLSHSLPCEPYLVAFDTEGNLVASRNHLMVAVLALDTICDGGGAVFVLSQSPMPGGQIENSSSVEEIQGSSSSNTS